MRWFGSKKQPDETTDPGNADTASEEPRRKIGKYEILEKIATGGFGTVYKAWDPLIKRAVALKTCEVPDAAIRARVFREAQLAGGLQHPNITTVFEFGVDGIVPFLAQELLSGEDLDKVIARNDPLPVDEKVRILIDVASALECAHGAGVIHRDVKPANIRLLENGVVKIMDFGIAKSLDSTTDITKDGLAVGSSLYMSPEQIVGDPVDVRTDIFSLGVVAYELATGRKPFENEKLFLLLEQIVKTEPLPVAQANPDVPPQLASIIERAMRKKPEERFASASELKLALEAVREDVSAAEAAKAAALPRPAGAPILVVDDDPHVRQAVRELLEVEGYPVETAAEGAEAIRRMRDGGVCMILLDLAMPGMDGWQFLERRPREAGGETPPIVLMSGLYFIRDAPGVSDFLRKPIDPARLLECVRRFCGEPAPEATRAAG